jgi:large subunit ribosomal protein L15
MISILNVNNLLPLVKSKKRVGRGVSRGRKSGRGDKGQRARSGFSNPFAREGGQTPIYRRLPKRGFCNYGAIQERVVSTDRLIFAKECFVVNGVLDLSSFFSETSRDLFVKLVLGNSVKDLHFPVHFESVLVDKASKGAVDYLASINKKILYRN